MPPLKDVLTTGLPEGYSPVVDSPLAPQPNSVTPSRSNPRMRTPLPSTNADADLIRQVEGAGQNPQFRMLPLQPIQGSVSVTTGGGSSSSSSSSSGGSGSSSSINPVSVSLAIQALGAESAAYLSVKMSQSFQLLSISSNNPLCIRLYGSAAAQSGDTARSVDAPVPAETGQNIIIDVVLDTSPYIWYTQNIIGANLVFPQTNTVYVTAINDNSVELSGTNISITYVPLET